MKKPNSEKGKKRSSAKRVSGKKAPKEGPRGELGQRLRDARMAKGYTNRDALARELGIAPLTLYRLESGLTQRPDPETAQPLVAKLDIDESWLLHGVGKGPTKRSERDQSEVARAFAQAVEKYLTSAYGKDTPPAVARLLRELNWASVGVTDPGERSIHRAREFIEANANMEQHASDEEDK